MAASDKTTHYHKFILIHKNYTYNNKACFYLLSSILLQYYFQFSRSSRPQVFRWKVFRKYAANLQKNTHAEVWFQ